MTSDDQLSMAFPWRNLWHDVTIVLLAGSLLSGEIFTICEWYQLMASNRGETPHGHHFFQSISLHRIAQFLSFREIVR
jgi:hypothetical protein